MIIFVLDVSPNEGSDNKFITFEISKDTTITYLCLCLVYTIIVLFTKDSSSDATVLFSYSKIKTDDNRQMGAA